MMPQLQKGQSRTLQIYCRNFRLLKPSLPASILHTSYVNTHFVFLAGSYKPENKTPRNSVAFSGIFNLRALHHVEEVIVSFGHRQFIDEEFHRVDFTHRVNDFTQDPHLLQLFLSGEQLFFTGTGTVVIDSREDAFFCDLTRDEAPCYRCL